MTWKEKSKEIAERLSDTLGKTDFSDNIVYDENGRLDMSYICHAVRPYLEQAAMDGMRYECDIAVIPLLDKMNKDR